MDIFFSYDQEFCELMDSLKKKYGERLFELDGIGKKQLDINNFSKEFFNNRKATADVSVDANSNITQSDIITYNVELPKPFFRLNAYFILWKKLKELYGKEESDRIIEMQLTGDIYINDFHGLQSPYCFNYSTYDIALLGLPMVTKIKSIPPKHLYSFKSELEQFVVYASNSTLGAVGIADAIIVMSYYIDKIIKTGIDAKFELKNEKAIWVYVKENIVSLIYTLNQPFRGGQQSAFTNISIFDDNFLKELVPEYKFVDEKGNQITPKIETIKKTQEIFLDVMNEELSRTPVTFPITTACISVDENNNPTDQEFIKVIAEKNKRFGFINIYCGKTSTISSCCRLRSDNSSEYFNSFGAGSTKIGSLGVVTTNLPRLAIKSETKEKFLENLKNLVIGVARINNAKRHIIRKRIEVGASPLYTFGFMSLQKQYSTFGITGLNEAVELLGYDILKPDGQQLLLDMLKVINKTNDKLQKQYESPHNVEMVPAENSITGDEQILIYDNNNNLLDITIKDFFKLFNNDADTIDITKYGYTALSNNNSVLEKNRITHVMRHTLNNKTLYKITTDKCGNIKITKDHSIFVLDKNLDTTVKTGDNINIGDYCVSPNTVFINKKYELYISDYIDNYYIPFDSEIFNRYEQEIKTKYLLFNNKTPWHTYKNSKYSILNKYIDNILTNKNITQVKTSHKNSFVNNKIKLNKNLGYLLGMFLSEGYINNKKKYIQITNTNLSIINKLEKIMIKTFGKNSYYIYNHLIKNDKYKPMYSVFLNSTIYHFFIALGLDGNANTKKIPQIFLNTNNAFLYGILLGYIAGDGYISLNKIKRDYYVRLYTNSINLKRGLCNILTILGIKFTNTIDKKSKHNPNWNDNHVIKISGLNNINKIKGLNLNLSETTTSTNEYVPFIANKLKYILKQTNLTDEQIYKQYNIRIKALNGCIRNNRMTKKNAINCFEKMMLFLPTNINTNNKTLIKKIKKILYSSFGYYIIKKKKEINSTNIKYVYDLSVENTENFIAGTDGKVLLHNSGIKLSKKDALLKYTEDSLFYSNQFIPLIKSADILDRIKLQGLFDSHFSGGSILHLNVEEKINDTQKIIDLINTCAKKGVVYWAINYNLQMCEADHMSIGANGNCPICGKPIKENFTRVVGFLTNTKHWNITRRTVDYPNRQFYKEI
jgi:ribonucleoside-triphosphate reductase